MIEVDLNLNTGIGRIIIDDTIVKLRLYFKNFKVQLLDDSATGKTYLCNLLSKMKHIYSNELKDIVVINRDNASNLENMIISSEGKLFVIDDLDAILTEHQHLVEVIRNDFCRNFYLLIGRRGWSTGITMKEFAELQFEDSKFRFKYDDIANSKRELEKCNNF